VSTQPQLQDHVTREDEKALFPSQGVLASLRGRRVVLFKLCQPHVGFQILSVDPLNQTVLRGAHDRPLRRPSWIRPAQSHAHLTHHHLFTATCARHHGLASRCGVDDVDDNVVAVVCVNSDGWRLDTRGRHPGGTPRRTRMARRVGVRDAWRLSAQPVALVGHEQIHSSLRTL